MVKILRVVRNKYFIASTAFVVWMLFFDRNDLPSQIHYQRQLSHLKQEKEFYTQEMEQVQQDLKELSSEGKQIQKFARERYFMKKDNEDVFVIVDEDLSEMR